MTGLGLLGLRPADPDVLEVGGGHHDPMMVLCWLVTGVLELLGGAALPLRRRSKDLRAGAVHAVPPARGGGEARSA